MKSRDEMPVRQAEDFTLGLSREDFAELITGGFDAWCVVLANSAAQQPVRMGGARPHRWDALSSVDGAVDARRINDSRLAWSERE